VKLLGLLALIVLAAGCAPAPQAVATGERWRMTLSSNPQARALRPVTLTLRVTDPAGRPIAVDRMRATAGMQMTHQGDPVAFLAVAPGIYEARHTFSMDGTWIITLAGVGSGAPLAAEFPVEVGP
jgi:nitrogen fixation protein FixH